MNRAITFLVPPLAFGLAAVAAWLTGAPAPAAISPENGSSIRSPRRLASAMAEPGDPSAAISEFERKIFNSPAPPVKLYDAAGMDAMLDSDSRNSSIPDAGFQSIRYSLEWAGQAPEDMLAWLVRQSASSYNRSTLPAKILFREWAKKDMSSALAAVAKIPVPDVRAQALITTLEFLCKDDPDHARKLLVENLSLFSPDRPAPMFDISESGRPTSDLLLSLPPGVTRTFLLAELLKDMAGRGYDMETVTQAHAVWDQSPEDLRRDLVAAGFSSDKDNAVVFPGLEDLLRDRAETSGDPAVAEKFIETQGGAWAGRDLAGALDWARTHLKGRSREKHSAALFESAAGADFDSALGIWQSLPDGETKVDAAEAMLKGAPEERKAEATAALESVRSSE